MPKESKLIDEELVSKAKIALEALGPNSFTAIRLKSIIAAYHHGIKKVSEVYDINRSSLHRWVSLFASGNIDSIKNANKPPRSKLSQAQAEVIRGWIEADSSVTINKLCNMIKNKWGLSVGKSSVHRLLQKLGFAHITGRKSHYKSDPAAQLEFKKKSTR